MNKKNNNDNNQTKLPNTIANLDESKLEDISGGIYDYWYGGSSCSPTQGCRCQMN